MLFVLDGALIGDINIIACITRRSLKLDPAIKLVEQHDENKNGDESKDERIETRQIFEEFP